MAKYPDMEKWGKNTAKERYGATSGTIPVKASAIEPEPPQCPEDARDKGYDNETPSNWLRGMPNAEGKPSFDRSSKGK